MDEKEAIKWQKSFMMMHGNTKEAVTACKIATNALERQIGKEPEYESNEHGVHTEWICPNCGRSYKAGYEDFNHCPKCGQRILHTKGD